MSGTEEVLESIEKLRKKIKKIFFIDEEKYAYFKNQLDELEEKLGQASWERVYREYLDLELEYITYMEISVDGYKLVLDSKELTPGKDKIKDKKISLLEEISARIYDSEVGIEKLKKLKELWDKEIDENEYDEVELRRIQKAFAKIFLAYQIRYAKNNEMLPDETIEEYCDIEAYENEFEDRIIEMLSSEEVDSNLKGEIGLLFLQGGKNQLSSELFKNKSAWKLLTGIDLDLGNELEDTSDDIRIEYNNIPEKVENLTFLTVEQCFDDKEMLDVIRKRGTQAAITDFAILNGGMASSLYHFNNDKDSKEKPGYYWTISDCCGDSGVFAVDADGKKDVPTTSALGFGARLVLPFSSTSNIPMNRDSKVKVVDGVNEVEFGYYPRTAVDKGMQVILEQKLNLRSLPKTGNGYTTSAEKVPEQQKKFNPMRYDEYEYRGKRYVRVRANLNSKNCTLLNGETYKDGDYVWVEVEPVKWLVDEKSRVMITNEIVFSGIRFNYKWDYETRNFKKTIIKRFIDKFFAKELLQQRKLGVVGYGVNFPTDERDVI